MPALGSPLGAWDYVFMRRAGYHHDSRPPLFVPRRSLCALRAHLHAAMRNVNVALAMCGIPV